MERQDAGTKIMERELLPIKAPMLILRMAIDTMQHTILTVTAFWIFYWPVGEK